MDKTTVKSLTTSDDATAGTVAATATIESSEEDLDELLVEEISIDGMCGVY